MGSDNDNIIIFPRRYVPDTEVIAEEGLPIKKKARRTSPKKRKDFAIPEWTWEFKPRFRRHAFGWKSAPAIKRIKEATAEIKKVARTDKILAADGAVIFLERLSPALEHVDSSSGAIGNAVYSSIKQLTAIIASADAGDELRSDWLDRLWCAIQEDDIPYLESLDDEWGELCAGKALASKWADTLMAGTRNCFESRSSGYFRGTGACLSCLLKAERYEELFELLKMERHGWFSHHVWGARALAATGKTNQAIDYVEENCRDRGREAMSKLCEEILLADGQAERAYENYAIAANQCGTYIGTFRAICKKYPDKSRAEILQRLVRGSPESPGKWFAAAKDAGELEMARELAMRYPCDPKTLTRAARDFQESNAEFARDVGLAALRWMMHGYGYELTGMDVYAAYAATMGAAERCGVADETRAVIRDAVERSGGSQVAEVLRREVLR